MPYQTVSTETGEHLYLSASYFPPAFHWWVTVKPYFEKKKKKTFTEFTVIWA